MTDKILDLVMSWKLKAKMTSEAITQLVVASKEDCETGTSSIQKENSSLSLLEEVKEDSSPTNQDKLKVLKG